MRAPHPFPARMAPDLALTTVSRSVPGPVLDPMCGSGTVLRAALEAGRRAIGFDVDPLAVLMSQVWTTAPSDDLEGAAAALVSRAMNPNDTHLPWIDEDQETTGFINFWFARSQQHDLRRIAAVLFRRPDDAETNALRLALSRTIVTKDRGASRASDVSHSRPHRTRRENDYDVLAGFKIAARSIARALGDTPTGAQAVVGLGDARALSAVAADSVGLIVTSPPYLNAIDYLRGHRLALVWLGYRVSELRAIRAASIGSERGWDGSSSDSALAELCGALGIQSFAPRLRGVLTRYVNDLDRMMGECYRVLRSGQEAVFVVGNSLIRDEYLDNAKFTIAAGERHGLRLIDRFERELPPRKRYLPPPKKSSVGFLSKRMRSEVVLRMQKPLLT